MIRLFISAVAVLFAASNASAQVYLFDMGADTSAVWEGFTAVTPSTIAGSGEPYGWESPDSIVTSGRRYEMDEDGDPPNIWTSPITEDALLGTRSAILSVTARPGEYQIYALCGTSDGARDQFFDFTISAGGDTARVQIESGRRFRAVRLDARVTESGFRIHLDPASAWCLAALVISPASETQRVERDVIQPIEEWTFRLPPDEWATWKQDAFPDPMPLPELSADVADRGFLLFQRPWSEPIYPHTRPTQNDPDPELRLFASQDEYEPATFTLHALRDLTHVRLTVSDIGPIRASEIDVRKVSFTRARPNYRIRKRYRIIPDAIERFQTLQIGRGENVRFWLTVHVSEGTPAGIYHGQARLTADTESVTVPVQLRVLPIQLRENPDHLYSIYYRHPYDRMRQAEDPVSREYFRRRAEMEHADMAAHGTRNTVLSVWSPAADENGQFDFDWDHLQAKLDLWDKYGFKPPIVMGIPTQNVYRKYVGKRYGSHLSEIELPPQAFSRELTDLVRTIEAERKERGWPEFLYYPVDEPGRDSTAIQFMIQVLSAVKDAGVRTYLTASPVLYAFQPLKPYVDVWCTQPFLPARETALADMAEREIEYWCYPNHVNGENDHTPVTGARMTYGFGFWQSGFKTLIPWIYSWSSGDPENYLDGSMSDFFNGHEPDGTPVPVAMWEAYREGYDDGRYIYTLESLIRVAEGHLRPDVRAAGANARQTLDGIWNAIRVQPKYKYDGLWAPAEFDVYRWMIAQEILELQGML